MNKRKIEQLEKKLNKKYGDELNELQFRKITNTISIEDIAKLYLESLEIVKKIKKEQNDVNIRIEMWEGTGDRKKTAPATTVEIILDESLEIERILLDRDKKSIGVCRIVITNFSSYDIEIKRKLKKMFNITNYGNINMHQG